MLSISTITPAYISLRFERWESRLSKNIQGESTIEGNGEGVYLNNLKKSTEILAFHENVRETSMKQLCRACAPAVRRRRRLLSRFQDRVWPVDTIGQGRQTF